MPDQISIDLSIIIVAWNVKDLLDECLTALRASTDTLKKQILFVDNGSVDGSVDFIRRKYPEVEIIESPENLGFIRANNLAYKQAKGKFILMLNSDAFVFPESIQKTVDFMEEHQEAGVVGARLIGRDGVLQPSARFFPTPFKIFLSKLGLDGKIPFIKPLDDLNANHEIVRECDWVVGCYLLTRKDLVDKMGFFLREDYFMYNDDNDLCFRIKKLGYKTFFYPVPVIHLGGANMKKMKLVSKKSNDVEKFQIESQLIYFRKNYNILYVIGLFALSVIFNIILLVKKVFLPKRDYTYKDIISNIILWTTISCKTRLGCHSIH